jgi:hypothetical protein
MTPMLASRQTADHCQQLELLAVEVSTDSSVCTFIAVQTGTSATETRQIPHAARCAPYIFFVCCVVAVNGDGAGM